MEHSISRVIANIYDTIEDPASWTGLFQQAAQILPIDYADFVVGHHVVDHRVRDPSKRVFHFGLGDFQIENRSAFQERPGILEHYCAEFSFDDPLVIELDNLISSFHELPSVRKDGNWSKSRYYNEFLRTHDVTRPARFVSRVSPTKYMSMNVNWSKPYEVVSSADRRLFNLIASHCARAIDLAESRLMAQGGIETMMRTLDMVEESAFLLDRSGRVLDMNRCARELIKFDNALSIRAGKLEALQNSVNGEVHTRLQQMNQSHSTEAASTAEFSIPSRAGPKPLKARFVPVGSHARLHEAGPESDLVILIVDSRHVEIAGRLLARAVLTSRERQTMLCLAAYGSEQRAADAMSVSVNTLRTHRRNSYSKLGISNRVELLELLSI